MITARDIAKVLSVLDQLSTMSADKVDITDLEILKIRADFAAIPFRIALGTISIPVQKNISEEACATSQC